MRTVGLYQKMVIIDLTDRFSDYIKDSEIYIKGASFPPGKHYLLFEIRDESGYETKRNIVFVIK